MSERAAVAARAAVAWYLAGLVPRAQTPLAVAAHAAALVAVAPAGAQCPVGRALEVDFDRPGSGYAETTDNWTSWSTSPCAGATYRYLSHTVGDGSRRGKAIFRPGVDRDGYWRFETAFRATENRTSDADYWVHHDDGAPVHRSVDQRGDGCTWVDLGTYFCRVGGECRIELDGTDDAQSDGADVSRFTLVSCGDAPDGGSGAGGAGPGGRCDALRGDPAYEVCEETATTCAGVFTDGSGCAAFCAAAGMACTARFGGEPGCSTEPGNAIPCDAANGHGSDWCECVGPPLADAGASGGAGGASGGASPGGAAGTSGASVDAGGWPEPGGTGGAVGASGGASGASGAPGGGDGPGAASRGSTSAGDPGGCSCGLPPRRLPGAAALGLLALLAARRRRATHSQREGIEP